MKMLIIIACCATVFACRKSEQYPSRLTASKNQVTSYPKMYTRLGEITSKAIITKYVNALTENYFNLNADAIITTTADTITYKSVDTAIFSSVSNTLWKTRIVSRNGQYKYFYMTDTLVGYKPIASSLDYIGNKIGIFKPYYRDACPGSGPFSCSLQEVYDAFIATGSQQKLEFPLLTYRIARGTYNALARKNYNNVFDNSVLNILQDGDTLLIQTSKRIYTN